MSGGGYGGNINEDGLSNGCSTIGISKTTPVEVMEQFYPVLFEEYSLHEGSGGAGKKRGGFGVNYKIKIIRGNAKVSMVMDHGRFGPQGVLKGKDGGLNFVKVVQSGESYIPPHLSKDQNILVQEGDTIHVSTPGGGGYEDPFLRTPELVLLDVLRGYYSIQRVKELFGVVINLGFSNHHIYAEP